MGRLEGKVAIVTGASSGMGAAITKRFAAEGAKVIAIARRKEKLQGVIDEVVRKGGTAIAVSGDVAKEEDVKNAVKTAVREFGKLDIVVNNAGSLDRVAPAWVSLRPVVGPADRAVTLPTTRARLRRS